ncbi:HNH endonuclease signature motif containing protein [Trujillonella endophytica]|uniref:HNH nuclease domain-containing protein n=1 Tax=Trujillonella endophytica TaxID=673521 RepID=A0A1H8RSZ0_9ACTN|nr:HNH endonuclease signature motif containing protein [Trujillella endophytica]SEO69581.1 protein of unknown function [Trujillella endophytica]
MCSTDGPGADEERLHALTDAELLAEVAALVAEQNWVAARLTAAVRVADARQAAEHDGLKTMQSWLRTHCGMKRPAASALVHRGRALDLLPATGAAFAAGAIGADHVTEIARITAPQHVAAAAEQGVDLAAVDAALATIATGRPFQALAEAVADYLARLDPDGPEPDPARQRALTIARHPDGTVTMHAELDSVGGEKVTAVLESMAAASRCAADDRTAAQRRADALVQWADNTLAAGQVPTLRTRRSQIAAVVGVDALVDPATGKTAARTGFGATLSAARARWLACDSTVARVVMGTDGEPLDRGREVRIVPAPLRHLLDLRDAGCVFAGCDAPYWWCEAHHILHWAFGGETEPDNLGLLCERHHGKVHHGFRIERDPGGAWHTYRPDGTELLLHREDLLTGKAPSKGQDLLVPA